MNKLYEALELSLLDMEQGADIETVLLRYPEFAEELRPILEASANARRMAVPGPSMEVVRRNRVRVLQHAAGMRKERAQRASRRLWFTSMRRLAVTLVVIAVIFGSGTGLVRAASATLPGDNLYPVKRTWEDVIVLFTFNLQQREALEIEHANERLEELSELFAKGRSEKVDFAGLVTLQNGSQWLVNGVPVRISAQTRLPDQPVGLGSAVRVVGMTQGDGAVLAERIKLLPPGAKLPKIEHETEVEGADSHGPSQQSGDNSGPGSEDDAPHVEETETPKPEGEDGGSNSGHDSGSEDGGSGSGTEDDSHEAGEHSATEESSGSKNSGPGSGGDEGEH